MDEQQKLDAMMIARGNVMSGLDVQDPRMVQDGIEIMRKAGCDAAEIDENLARLGVPRRRDGLYGRF